MTPTCVSPFSPLTANTPVWCLIPAAGIGSRMQAARPKQYLLLQQKPLLQHTLERVLRLSPLSGVLVMLSPDDDHWLSLAAAQHPLVSSAMGGAERAQSVLMGLQWLVAQGHEQAWVLVHDAARPCVKVDDIARLCEQVIEHKAVGGILAVPVADTLKQASLAEGADTGVALSPLTEIQRTVDRRLLWQAQTPQLFPVIVLKQALEQALAAGHSVTDESSALELLGFHPLIVEGRSDNIKVTRPDDLRLAEIILQQQTMGDE